MEKRKPSYTVGRNVSWCSHCGEQLGRFLRKLKTELPCDPAIPLLGIYPDKTISIIQKDTYTSMFMAALFTRAKTWKQTKYSSTDEGIKIM